MCPHTSPKVFTSAYSYRVNVGNTVSRKLCTCVECFCQTSIYVIFLWKVQQENCSQRTRNLLFQSDNKSSFNCSLFMCVCFLVAGCSHIFRNGKTISRTPLCCSRKNPTTIYNILFPIHKTWKKLLLMCFIWFIYQMEAAAQPLDPTSDSSSPFSVYSSLEPHTGPTRSDEARNKPLPESLYASAEKPPRSWNDSSGIALHILIPTLTL